jgi:hypothetical protein
MTGNFPEHRWNDPAVVFIDDTQGVPWCPKHKCMTIMSPATLADYCPFCAYNEACTSSRCYCLLVRRALAEDRVPWKEPLSRSYDEAMAVR